MKISTRKALRTLAQGIIAAAAAIPTLAEVIHVPAGRVGQVVAATVAAAAVVTKVWNAIEAKWPAASRYLLGGAVSTVDVGTGETVTPPAAAAAIGVSPADNSPTMGG